MNINPTTVASPAIAPKPASPPSGTGSVGATFGSALEGVSDALAEADQLSQQVATGEIADLSQLTAAAAKAELAVDMTVAFRDRAISSFQQIMQMQV